MTTEANSLPGRSVRRFGLTLAALWLAGCAAVQYQPLPGIGQVDTTQGYRLRQAITAQKLPGNADDLFVVMMFSGGGTRAAALGYGVLEEMRRQQFDWHGQRTDMAGQVDITFGVSGGSMLSAYYALHGEGIFPRFEQQFLKRNLQRKLARQVFALSNWPRLTSPEFGRGDLLEEQLNQALFRGATFGDLAQRRKGPLTVISATDMSAGSRLDFVQEVFDVLCLDLARLPLARAVAASSAVPLVFAPLTLNNNGGNCHYQLPEDVRARFANAPPDELRNQTRAEILKDMLAYGAQDRRPYLHLLDGGLTDNLGLRSVLDASQIYSANSISQMLKNARKVVLINVNAQNRMDTAIDQAASVPGLRSVVQALINIPIDKNSQESMRQFRRFVDDWRNTETRRAAGLGEPAAEMYFISLELKDLHDDSLRAAVLDIPTSLYLPPQQIDQLRHAGSKLLRDSEEFQRLRRDLVVTETPAAPAEPDADMPGAAGADAPH